MKFLRADFLSALKMVEPAIAQKELIGQLVHVWFDGQTITAYNDVIGIEAPLATDFKGGLRGSVLLGILANSGAIDVEVKEGKEGEMRLKAAGAHVNLALLPETNSLFKIPDLSKSIKFDADFVASFNKMLISVGDDASMPDQLGVTVIDKGDRLRLFATDSKTISTMTIPKPENWNETRVTVPATFCSELMRICKDGGELSINDRNVIAVSASGVRLFSRLVAIERPLDFETILKKTVPEKIETVAIPDTFKRAVDRVGVLMDGKSDVVSFFFEKNSVGMFLKTGLGEIDDVIKLKHGTHRDIERKLDPMLIKRVIDCCDNFMLSEDCMVMTGSDDFTYLISIS